MTDKEDGENIYYISNKGAREIPVFLNDADRLRFIYNLLTFQKNKKKTGSLGYGFLKYLIHISKEEEYKIKVYKNKEKGGNYLAEVFAFALLPQSFHLLLKTNSKSNLALFLKKVCASYSLYFNKKYKKTGAVFEGRYKAVLIKNKEYLIKLLYYIHSLPLRNKDKHKIKEKNWDKYGKGDKEYKTEELKNSDFEFLKTYRWSSHLDYCGWNNFPKIINKEALWDTLEGPEKYKESLLAWLLEKEENIEEIDDILLGKRKRQ